MRVNFGPMRGYIGDAVAKPARHLRQKRRHRKHRHDIHLPHHHGQEEAQPTTTVGLSFFSDHAGQPNTQVEAPMTAR